MARRWCGSGPSQPVISFYIYVVKLKRGPVIAINLTKPSRYLTPQVKDRNTGARNEICSKLKIKTPDRPQPGVWRNFLLFCNNLLFACFCKSIMQII